MRATYPSTCVQHLFSICYVKIKEHQTKLKHVRSEKCTARNTWSPRLACIKIVFMLPIYQRYPLISYAWEVLYAAAIRGPKHYFFWIFQIPNWFIETLTKLSHITSHYYQTYKIKAREMSGNAVLLANQSTAKDMC